MYLWLDKEDAINEMRQLISCTVYCLTLHTATAQICINIHPDAVPPIHVESYHVATDKGPLQVPVCF